MPAVTYPVKAPAVALTVPENTAVPVLVIETVATEPSYAKKPVEFISMRGVNPPVPEAVALVVTLTEPATSKYPVVIFPASRFAITALPIGAEVHDVPPAPTDCPMTIPLAYCHQMSPAVLGVLPGATVS